LSASRTDSSRGEPELAGRLSACRDSLAGCLPNGLSMAWEKMVATLGGLRNRRSLSSRWALILRAAETKDRPENDAQKSEADSEAHTFTEALRHIDAEDNSHDDVNERDEQQNDPPAGSTYNLAPDVKVIDRDEAGPARLAGFSEYFPHRHDQQQCDE
jgi:hypothetical protein